MEDILKTLYLRTDSATQSLTRAAEKQMLIKIAYSFGDDFSVRDICSEYCKFVHSKNILELHIRPLIDELVLTNDIRPSTKGKGKYKVSKSQKRKIQEAQKSAEDRNQRILEKYFQRSSTEKGVLKLWLSDITQAFFNCFSDMWISDLNFHKGAIEHSKEDIQKLVVNRTKSFHGLEKSDKEFLPICFFELITSTSDGDVTDFLWEYGTSAFAAKLLASGLGADALAIDSIKDSTCFLDTNILMNLGLEMSEYATAFRSLEKVFKALNVSVKYLHVTQKEYENTVGTKITQILSNVSHYEYEVIKADSNHYVQTAIARQCVDYDDFKRFFDPLRTVPSVLNETLQIIKEDNKDLAIVVDKASNDQSRIDKMQSIFVSFTDREKRWSPLIHDVAFTAGVEFLRRNEKCFILSQDYLINKYSKEHVSPSQGLPLAVKLETLINMLAIYNGGTDVFDYKPLFSFIVSHGYCPKKDLFTTTDLYRMREVDNKISQLEANDVVNIAKLFHRERMDGKTDNELALTLSRKIGDAEIRAFKELKSIQDDLALEKQEKEHYKKGETTVTKVLKEMCTDEAAKEYTKSYRNKILKTIVMGVIGVVVVIVMKLTFSLWEENNYLLWVAGIIGGFVSSFITFFVSGLYEMTYNRANKEAIINKRAAELYEAKIAKSTK